MDMQSKIGAVPPVQQVAPPPPEPDGRAVADVAASKKDPTPEAPLPAPVTGSQSGLISKVALSEKDASPKLGASGISEAERLLKPYGINMLPEKTDPTKQETPSEPNRE